jgi:thioester reductase-like protein
VRKVFLTGATGTIGSALVPRLLADHDTTVELLIRARDDADLQTRLDRMFMYWNYRAGDAQASRIRALRGDISLPAFDLTEASQARLAAEATHIIHCAASVNLGMSLDRARATAVVPTRTVLEFGRRGLRAGTLRKIDLVSTVGVWGRTPGLMPERRVSQVEHFHNTYESAKAEAERVIWAEGAGLPISVHRPSMVVGETGSGRIIHFQIFYHLCEFLSGARTFGIMPGLEQTRLDTIPVDWVAKAIDWASRDATTAGRIFHLCSGAGGAITLPRLQEKVRMAWQQRGRRLPALHSIDRRLLKCMVPVVGMLAGHRARRALRALPPVLAYLAEDQGFANDETANLLGAAGLPVPRIEDYLDSALGYYLDARAKGVSG